MRLGGPGTTVLILLFGCAIDTVPLPEGRDDNGFGRGGDAGRSDNKSIVLFAGEGSPADGGDADAPTATLSATLAWRLDYRDWTSPAASEDFRGCDNEPATSAGPAYDDLVAVNIKVDDPLGEISPISENLPCEAGAAGEVIAMYGAPARTLRFALAAETADGTVLYRHPTLDEWEEIDLATVTSPRFDLAALSGELHFFPVFPGLGPRECPPPVETFRVQLFELKDGVPAAAAAVDTAHPACSGGIVREVFARNLPSHPERVGTDDAIPVYRLRVEALDSGAAVLFCAEEDRVVAPGNNNLTANPSLLAGACL